MTSGAAVLPPVQMFFLASALVILPVAWLKGGHPERAGAALLIAAYVAAPFLGRFRIGEAMPGLAIEDVIILSVFLSLALKHDRWWLLLASGAQSLNVLSHVALLVASDVTAREAVGAQWVFGLVSLYALFAGLLERRLAGEPSAAPPLDRRKAAQT